jgi:threonine/homoserine/homoserine lactone efflux protein
LPRSRSLCDVAVMMSMSAEVWTILAIAAAQLVAVVSPGPSFLITARTAVVRSRGDGMKVAAGLAAGTIVWAGAALFGLNALFQALPALFLVMSAILESCM